MANDIKPPYVQPPVGLTEQIRGGVQEARTADLNLPKVMQQIPLQTWPQEIARMLMLKQGMGQAMLGEGPLERFGFGPLSAARRQFQPIAAQARRSLLNEYAPALAERFTALGIESPTGEFSRSMAGAAGDLEAKLAALQARQVMSAQAQREKLIPSMLQTGLQPGFQQFYAPKIEGLPQTAQGALTEWLSPKAAQAQDYATKAQEYAAQAKGKVGGFAASQYEKLKKFFQDQGLIRPDEASPIPQQQYNESGLPQGFPEIQGVSPQKPLPQSLMKFAHNPAMTETLSKFQNNVPFHMPIISDPNFGEISLQKLADLLEIAAKGRDQYLQEALANVKNIGELDALNAFITERKPSLFKKLPRHLRDILEKKSSVKYT